MKNKKILKHIAFVFLIVFGVLVVWYCNIAIYNKSKTVDLYDYEDTEEDEINISQDVVYEYSFVSDYEVIKGVILKFFFEDDLESGEILVNLIDNETNQIIRSTSHDYERFENDGDLNFIFSPVLQDVKGKDYTIQIGLYNFEKNAFSIAGVSDDKGNKDVYVRIDTIHGGDKFYEAQNIIFIIFYLLLLAVFGWGLYFSKKIRIENVYLISALVLGLLFMVLIPLMAIPDEQTHAYIAYNLSNHMLGIEDDPSGMLIMRQDDLNAPYIFTGLGRWYYNRFFDSFTEPLINDNLIVTTILPAEAPSQLYFFSAIGISIGRLCGLNTTWTFMLGRIFNHIVFILIVYYAMKKIPFGKAVLFVWALLPMVLQQEMSYSYDSVINALCVLIVALTLNLKYGEKRKAEGWKKYITPEIIILLVACVLLFPCKGHVFLPIVVFPVLLLVDLLIKNKTKIKEYFSKNLIAKRVVIVLGIIAIICVGFVAYRILGNLISTADGDGVYIPYFESHAYPVGYYLKHPAEVFKLFISTILSYGDRFLLGMHGNLLGWGDISVPVMFIIPFMFFMLYAGARRENEECYVNTGIKIWITVVFVGVCVLSMLGMLLYWTPKGASAIEGVQGRYFSSVYFLVPLLFRTKQGCVSKYADTIVVCMTVLTYTFVIFSLMGRVC